MLFFLSQFSGFFGPLRLFNYVTFRAGCAAGLAFLIVVCFGAGFARWLREKNAQAADRYKGLFPPEMIDKRKNSTPSIGGLLLVAAVLISGVLFMRINWTELSIGWMLLGGTLSFALLGMADDLRKILAKDRDGISGKCKLFWQTVFAVLLVWGFREIPQLRDVMRSFYVPFCCDAVAGNSWWIPAFSVILIVGACNAVNLTDGKDGLASGCTIFCMLSYAVFTYLMGHRIFADHLNLPYVNGIEEAVVYSAAVGGACIGFLWHNCYPACMFMGDTGSLALGGAVGMLAVLTRQELLLILIGGIFVLEAVSVILQVASFKLFKRRIFACTPIHHHFERHGWAETQIVVRFWIISGLLALLALATLKLR